MSTYDHVDCYTMTRHCPGKAVLNQCEQTSGHNRTLGDIMIMYKRMFLWGTELQPDTPDTTGHCNNVQHGVFVSKLTTEAGHTGHNRTLSQCPSTLPFAHICNGPGHIRTQPDTVRMYNIVPLTAFRWPPDMPDTTGHCCNVQERLSFLQIHGCRTMAGQWPDFRWTLEVGS
eukprot:9477481-Pyramimonas_sp.AAC.1